MHRLHALSSSLRSFFIVTIIIGLALVIQARTHGSAGVSEDEAARRVLGLAHVRHKCTFLFSFLPRANSPASCLLFPFRMRRLRV
jgi:hypothetical protein